MTKEDGKAIRNANWISLGDNEEVKLWSHPSIFAHLPMMLVSGFIVIASLFVPFFFGLTTTWISASIVLILVSILLIIAEYIRYVSVFYVFTNRRIIRKRGILTQHVRRIGYGSIDKINDVYPIEGRILGYGDFKAVTASPDENDILMKFVPNLSKVMTVVENERQDDRVR